MDSLRARATGVAMVAAFVAVVAIALFAVFPAAGVPRFGPAAAGQYEPKKVVVCHHTRGKKGTKHVTIRVSRSALRAHQRHGDTVGACSTAKSKKAHAKKAHAKKFHKKKR